MSLNDANQKIKNRQRQFKNISVDYEFRSRNSRQIFQKNNFVIFVQVLRFIKSTKIFIT